MIKTSILSTILAGSLMVFGAFGCSHNEPAPVEPQSVSGQAAPAKAGDTTVNPQSTTPTTGSTGTMSNPGYQSTPDSSGNIDQRQPVKGTTDPNGNMPLGPSDTTAKPDTMKPSTQTPDPTNPPSSTNPK